MTPCEIAGRFSETALPKQIIMPVLGAGAHGFNRLLMIAGVTAMMICFAGAQNFEDVRARRRSIICNERMTEIPPQIWCCEA